MYSLTPTSFRSTAEPMNLGNSPPGYGHGSSSPLATGPQYYPEYLLGDPSSGCLSPGSRMWSTGFSIAQSPSGPSKSRQLPNQTSPNSSLSNTQSSSTALRFGRSSGVKAGGPPVQGLFDAGSSSPFPYGPTTSMQSSLGPHSERSLSESVLGQSFGSLNTSPAQLDPFYTQGESLKCDDQLDETWVTVFGFPPAAASYILQQFSLYGTVLEHKMANSGNWMHIHFHSRLQAKKALSKNGKVFNGNMMIGVSPCIDKSAMADSMKENIPSRFNLSASVASEDEGTPSRLSTVRPLTRAYQTASREHEVTPTGHTAQRKNTIVTKAMEYVLGW